MKFSKVVCSILVATVNLLLISDVALGNSNIIEQCAKRRFRENEKFYRSNGLNNRKLTMNDDDMFGISDRVDFSGFQISSLDLDANIFKNISSSDGITVLNLSINRIARIKKDAFDKFSKLRVLRMRMNAMSSLDAATFGGLMMLEELDLSCNAISDISSDTFRHLGVLRTIDLSENCIFHLANYVFFRNVHLSHLNLASNHIASLPHSMLPSDHFIFKMNVSSNSFTNMSSLLHFTNIQSLDLSYNSLSTVEMNAVLSEMEADGSSSEDATSSGSDDDDDRNAVIANDSSRNSNRHQHYRRHRSKRNFPFSSASSDSDRNSIRKHPDGSSAENSLLMQPTRNHHYHQREETAINNAMATVKDAKVDLALAASSSPLLQSMWASNGINPIRSPRRTDEQWNRLMKASRLNRMEYFTCRNCSLTSLALLQRLTELKYIDVSSNSIKVVESYSSKSFKHLEILLLSNNRIETLDFTRIVNAWPSLATLSLSNNPIKCSIASDVKYQAAHLRKVFHLHLNVRKCK